MNKNLEPKDHAEAVALFRAQVLGPLLCVDLRKRELASRLRELSEQRYMPPGAKARRKYAASTLERWYYRYRAQGLDGLRPMTRKSGHAQALTEEQRRLVLAIRRTHPNASVPLILRTLTDEGRVATGQVTASAVRRLLAAHGLDRRTLARSGKRERRRWEAERPGKLWHADVCHGPSLQVDGRTVPLRIHGMLDDASRFVPVLSARNAEREADMLEVLLQAIREHGKPDGLYLDNGATYRGEILATACGRLGITLLHAQPYDARARGKMERFWRTLREGCLDFLGERSSLHDVQLRLIAFLDAHYHHSAHAGLMGKSPAKAWTIRVTKPVTEQELAEALTVRERRKVHGDGTLSVGGIDWEVEDGWLSGRVVTIGRTLADLHAPPWVEQDGQRLALRIVDPKANARRRRIVHRAKRGIDSVDFDPNRIRVQRVLGRKAGTR